MSATNEPAVANPASSSPRTPDSAVTRTNAAPAVVAPEGVAQVAPETRTAVVAAPVSTANPGFAAPAPDAPDVGLNAPAPDYAVVSAANTLLANNSASSDQPASVSTSIGKPATSLTMNGQTIISPREPVTPSVVAPVEVSRGAFLDYKQDVTLGQDKPLFSIILLAQDINQANSVATMNAPVTLAVSADNPDAEKIVAAYLSKGGEALLYFPPEAGKGLVKGTSNADAKALLNQTLSAVPGVIGIVDGPDGSLTDDTNLLSAVLVDLQKTGHGIVTMNGIGRNRAEIMAGDAGMPVASIARRADVQAGTIPIIHQLDKSVLEIGSNGSSTVFATATEDVVFAMKFWIKSAKAKSVTLAPVSAIMETHLK